MDQKTFQKITTINKNRSKMGPWALLGGSWGQLGDHLGPKSSQEPFGGPKSISCDPPLAPQDGAMLEGFGVMLGLCWQVLVAGWWSEGPLTQHEAKDGER